ISPLPAPPTVSKRASQHRRSPDCTALDIFQNAIVCFPPKKGGQIMADLIGKSAIRPLSVYLGDLTYTTLSLATDAFPLNIGFVAAYAQKVFGKQIDLRLFKYVDDLEQAIHDKPPDILGLSNYPWNFSLGLEFFRMARTVSPQTICVM